MKRAVLATMILLAATGAAVAAPPAEDAGAAEEAASAPPSAEAGAAAAPAEEERKICRTEKATGSLTRRNRICMTAAQWREVHDRTRRGVGEMQGSGSGAPSCMSAADIACGTGGTDLGSAMAGGT